jgi:ADP-ribosyl-[dinitrogen reductase] hydrolase
MFVFGAVGDSVGAAYEFLSKERFHPFDFTQHFVQPDTGLGGGKYTDDTQMHMAMAEAMLSHPATGNKDITPLELADIFVEFYHRDPRPGYAMGFKNLLEECENGSELIEKIRPVSSRSGAVMRVPCVGGYKDIEKVIRVAKIQAQITHDTPIAIECASAVALAVHYLIHVKGPREHLGSFVNATLPTEYHATDWTLDRSEWASVEALDCTRNAFTAWRKSTTTNEILRNSIAPGGDTDTIASIAMCMAWADKSITNDLDSNLVDTLEQGVYGFPYLFDLSHSFYERFCRE